MGCLITFASRHTETIENWSTIYTIVETIPGKNLKNQCGTIIQLPTCRKSDF